MKSIIILALAAMLSACGPRTSLSEKTEPQQIGECTVYMALRGDGYMVIASPNCHVSSR